MASCYSVIRRLALFVSLTPSLIACVARLDDLEGTPEIDEASADTSATYTLETDLAASTEPLWETGSSFTSAPTTPAPATPACVDGLLNNDGFCVPRVRCAPGTFVSDLDGTRVCSPCASGQFSSAYDASECQAWRVCPAGEHVVEAGSASRDRACAECPDGSTSTTENSGTCTGASDCEAGTYESGGECIECSPGNYCSGKTQVEIPCAADTWDEDKDPATPCIVKTSCAPGQFVRDEGSTVEDRSCSFCGEEMFSTEGNAVGCARWSACGAGTYVSLQGTSNSDRECAACPAGTYSSSPNLASCQEWTTCSAPSEYMASEPSARQDRTCLPCASGYTAAEDNSSSCEEPVPANLVNNHDFESNANGWMSWVGTVSVSSNRAHTGSRSLLVTGSGTGPAATNLDAAAEAGATYNVNFWVNVGRVSTAQVNITRSLTCNGNVTYLWLANNPSVASGVWTQLSGTFTIPSSCGSPKMQVYAEGGGSNVDLYVDSVSVTKAP